MSKSIQAIRKGYRIGFFVLFIFFGVSVVCNLPEYHYLTGPGVFLLSFLAGYAFYFFKK